MTDPLTAAELDAIEQRLTEGRIVNVVAQRALFAEVRRLRSIVTRWEMEAERAERHGYDLDPHDLLAVLDGGE